MPDTTSTMISPQAQEFAARELGCHVEELELLAVSGGYTRNRKSLAGHEGAWLFAKEVDIEVLPDDGSVELGWLQKEFRLMQYLASREFDVVPEWSKMSDDGTVLIMPAYRPDDGWVWGYPDDVDERKSYIDAVVHAVRRLEAATFPEDAINTYQLQPHFRDTLAFDKGFDLILYDETIRKQIGDKLLPLAHGPHGEAYRIIA